MDAVTGVRIGLHGIAMGTASSTPATGISAGGEHTLVLQDDGRVVSLGACGLGYFAGTTDEEVLRDLYKAKTVALSNGESFKKICAGSYHNLAVTNTGEWHSEPRCTPQDRYMQLVS